MGVRKRESSNRIKEINKSISRVTLSNCPISPRKVRLVVDLIRNRFIKDAVVILKHTNKEASIFLEKLLLSGISNWRNKNEGKDVDEAGLYVSEIFVGGGSMLKRIQPAPQGRANRIRKRRCHITLQLDSKN